MQGEGGEGRLGSTVSRCIHTALSHALITSPSVYCTRDTRLLWRKNSQSEETQGMHN